MKARKSTGLAPPKPPIAQPLAERLVALGLTPNGYMLEANGTIQVPRDFPLAAPFDLPSRLFRFPVEYRQASAKAPEALGLLHPLLVDHPYVIHMQQQLGAAIPPGGAPNDHGYSRTRGAAWWHACDLGHAWRWTDLLATRHFTSDDAITRAVVWSVKYQGPKLKGSGRDRMAELRHVLRQVGAVEPSDRLGLLRQFMRPCEYTYEGREHCPINITPPLHGQPDREAWGMMLGVEAGWFAWDRNGHLQWTPAGRDAFGTGDSVRVEASGQHAFTF